MARQLACDNEIVKRIESLIAELEQKRREIDEKRHAASLRCHLHRCGYLTNHGVTARDGNAQARNDVPGNRLVSGSGRTIRQANRRP
jgi:hypothetical protein